MNSREVPVKVSVLLNPQQARKLLGVLGGSERVASHRLEQELYETLTEFGKD